MLTPPKIVNHIQKTLASNPDECFILQGYSQGAAATVAALPMLTGADFTAVKGVLLIGDPDHKSGLTCNVDNMNGTTTRNVNGLSAALSRGIPTNWIPKTLDVCIYVSRAAVLLQFLSMLIYLSGRWCLRHYPRPRHQCPAPRVPFRRGYSEFGYCVWRRPPYLKGEREAMLPNIDLASMSGTLDK